MSGRSVAAGNTKLTGAVSEKRLRVGILGCSDIARRKFIPALKNSAGAVLYGIASRDPGKAAAINPELQVRLFGYDALLSDPEIDLVYISLPNHLHEHFAIRALQSGKHVICEKPLSLSVASVKRMLACAAERKLLLFENLMYLHHPQHAAVKNVIESGEIGRMKSVRSTFCFPLPQAGNFRLEPQLGGGAFHDLGRYAVSTAWYFLCGRHYQFSGFTLDHHGLNVAMHGTALTSAQEIFSFSIAFGQPYQCSYEIVGDQGTVKVDRAYTTPADLASFIKVTSGGHDASFTIPPVDHFKLMLDDVTTLIGTGDFEPTHARNLCLATLAEQMERGCTREQLHQ